MKTATAKEKEVSKIYQSRDEKKLTKIKENMHREGKERKEREYKRDRIVHNEKKRKEKSRLEEEKRESNGKCIFMTKKLKEVEK